MTVKEFVGICADRNMEVIIKNEYGFPIAKGSVIEVFTSNHGKLLTRKVECFYCNDKQLYIRLK